MTGNFGRGRKGRTVQLSPGKLRNVFPVKRNGIEIVLFVTEWGLTGCLDEKMSICPFDIRTADRGVFVAKKGICYLMIRFGETGTGRQGVHKGRQLALRTPERAEDGHLVARAVEQAGRGKEGQ